MGHEFWWGGGTAEEDEAEVGRPIGAAGEQAVQHGGHNGDEGDGIAVQVVVDGFQIEAGVEGNGRTVQRTAK